MPFLGALIAGILTRALTVSYFHFPAKKSVQKGEVRSDPRAGYFFNEVRSLFSTKFRAPPLSASLSAGERGGYNICTYSYLPESRNYRYVRCGSVELPYLASTV